MDISSQTKKLFTIAAAFWILIVLYRLQSSLPISSPTTFVPPSKPVEHPALKTKSAHNIAAIIETRPLDNLAPLILHFSSILGPGWTVALFSPKSAIPTSSPFQRAIKSGAVTIHELPSNLTYFSNHKEVSEFLTTPWFWEQLAPAGHILLFQADSIICANAPLHVNNFLRYDFIGAPIDKTLGKGDVGMNGGLSLRNRTMVLKIIKEHSWKGELEKAEIVYPAYKIPPPILYEDQWFYQKLMNLTKHADGSPGARLPTEKEAMQFSVESLWYDTPVGFHQIGRWNMDRIKKVTKFCPELRLATNNLIYDDDDWD